MTPLIRTLYLSLFATPFVLTGCNTVPTQSAGDTFKHAMQHSVIDAKSYNFHMEQSLSISPAKHAKKVILTDAGYQPLMQEGTHKTPQLTRPPTSMAACDATYDAIVAKKPNKQAIHDADKAYLACLKAASQQQRQANKKIKKPTVRESFTPARINALNEYWFKPLTLHIDGAVDTRKKQMYVDYRIHYAPRNLTLAVNFPFFFDFNDMTMAVDPALLLPFIGPAFTDEIGTSWQGKWLTFSMPDEIKRDIPTDLILRAFHTALTNTYQSLDNQYFTFLPQQDQHADFPAARAIHIALPDNQRILLFDNLMANWVDAIEKEVAKNPTALSKPKQFKKFLSIAKKQTQRGLLGQQFSKTNGLYGLIHDTSYHVYIDNTGKLLGTLSNQKITALADLINANIHSDHKLRLSNHNRAKFPFRPSSDNTIDGNALIKKYSKQLKEKRAQKNPFGHFKKTSFAE